MERLCGLALGIAFMGHVCRVLCCALYRGGRIVETVDLRRCKVHPGRRKKERVAPCWVRGAFGFVRTTPAPVVDPYVYFGWQAKALCGGGCNGHDFPGGLVGSFRCRLLLRRTKGLLEHMPLKWYVKTGVAAPRGALPGQRLVPASRWVEVPAEAIQVDTKVSRDGRFLIVWVRWVKGLEGVTA